ncbi:MAG: YebC/PmpR family DNA-binding transcriptional regulator [Deferribacteres bacterium]|nr:YebC/PmpR family DNA-binding transcriptional regulator [candidate division KSB1 bacterium]MCB9510603.1 YebC/PmpR family DNA-binding transcriptional regulator [Deferribacteres bacterium]
MAGHSKWKQIKHKKAKADAERGKVFTRLIKEITVAARAGGGDEAANPRLRTAILAAKAANMPANNIDRAVKKGTGELPGVAYEEVTYEGYGPGGAALLIECLTDNKNRTVAEIRHAFSKYSGNLGESGSVAWMFERKGEITVELGDMTEEQIMEAALEAGAEDLSIEDGAAFLTCQPEDVDAVREALDAKNIKIEEAGVSRVAQNTVNVEGKNAEKMLKLMEVIEDHDDVQNVYSNFDIDEAVLEE